MLVSIFVKQAKSALAGEYDLEKFCTWFEDWFQDEMDNSKVDEKIYSILEDLYADIGYFEPDANIRKGHSSYYGREALIRKVQQVLEVIGEENS